MRLATNLAVMIALMLGFVLGWWIKDNRDSVWGRNFIKYDERRISLISKEMWLTAERIRTTEEMRGSSGRREKELRKKLDKISQTQKQIDKEKDELFMEWKELKKTRPMRYIRIILNILKGEEGKL